MKQDMFDQVQKNKRGGAQRSSKGPPECPKSDKMSAFASLAFAEGDWFVRINSTEGPCHRLITIGGANYSELRNASLTCGPPGEWKKRVAEEMSMVFFQGGLEWVKGENDTIEVVTEEGTFEVEVNEEKYATMMQCWARSCDCEQAKSPKARIVLITLFIIAFGGLSYDSVKLSLESLGKGKKPSKHPVCRKGHKIEEVGSGKRGGAVCDLCRSRSVTHSCKGTCNYDLCKNCFQEAKQEAKTKYKAWMEKHPEDPDHKKKKKSKSGDDDDEADSRKTKDEDETDSRKNEDSQSEAGDKKDSKKDSEAESDAPAGSEEKDETAAEDSTEKAEAKDGKDDE
jgi:hypothetical protein